MIVYEETDIGEDGEYVAFTIKAKSNDFTEFVNSAGTSRPEGIYEIQFEHEFDEEYNKGTWSYYTISKDGVELSHSHRVPFMFICDDYHNNVITDPIAIEIIPVYK